MSPFTQVVLKAIAKSPRPISCLLMGLSYSKKKAPVPEYISVKNAKAAFLSVKIVWQPTINRVPQHLLFSTFTVSCHQVSVGMHHLQLCSYWVCFNADAGRLCCSLCTRPFNYGGWCWCVFVKQTRLETLAESWCRSEHHSPLNTD